MDEVRAIEVVLIALGVAALTTPLVIRFAKRIGAVDRPNDRKVSRRQGMPLLGGLAVGAGCGAGLAAMQVLDVAPDVMPQAWAFAGGALILMLAGAWDDRFGLTVFKKLSIQILAASIAIQAGFSLDLFSNPLTSSTSEVPLWILWPVSLVWIVGVTNAMNLIDGLDGLSAGLGAIIAMTLTIICWQGGQWVGVVIGLALFGALLGYLPFNFPPARIFLGDAGSLVIGFALALIALEGYRKEAILAFLVPVLCRTQPRPDQEKIRAKRPRSQRNRRSVTQMGR